MGFGPVDTKLPLFRTRIKLESLLVRHSIVGKAVPVRDDVVGRS